MVNCGVRMVNCRPRVTKHARRKITFFTRPRAPVASLAKESRVKSYIQIISSPLPPQLTCRPCYWRRIRYLCLMYIHCVRLLRYRSKPRLERALISSSSKESACTFVRLPATVLSLCSRTDFNADEGCRCANVKG